MNQIEKQFETPAFYFQWHFLEACNLRCKHCYQGSYLFHKTDMALIDKTIEQIHCALVKWGMHGRISITGGEPFVEYDKLLYIMSKLSEIDCIEHLGILTNGTLITQTMVKELAIFDKLKEIQVSLDGASPIMHDRIRGNGNFSKTLDAISKLVLAGIPVAVMFTVSRLNINDAIPIISLAESLGVSAITIERYTPFQGPNDPLALSAEQTHEVFSSVLKCKEEYKKTQKKIKIRTSRPLWALLSDTCGGVCPVGFSCLTIMHDGTVFPCRRLPIPIGTVQNDGLFKIWYTSQVLWQLRKRNWIEECGICDKKHCCGGCRAAAYAHSKNFMGKDPLCWKE